MTEGDEAFLGHVGGDDFVVILHKYVEDDFFKDFIKQFRRGEVEHFPLITLTAVMVNNGTKAFKDVVELTEMLAGLKKVAKQVLKG